MSESFTKVFFVENEFEEEILLKNPTFINNEEKLVLFSTNYNPKILKDKILKAENFANIEKTVKELKEELKTEWFLLLKASESLDLPVNLADYEPNTYYVVVETLLDRASRRDNLIVYEKRLFNTQFASEGDFASDLIISDYYQAFAEIEENEIDHYRMLYSDGDQSLKTVLFLLERQLIDMPPQLLEQKYLNQFAIKTPELLGLFIYLFKAYKRENQFNLATNTLFKAINLYPDSPTINFYLAEMYFKANELENAKKHLLTCTEMANENNFYKFYRFPVSIITYIPFYHLGKIYLKENKLEEAKLAFEECLEYKTNFEPAERELEEVIILLDKKGQLVNELNFACQSCGSCCRHFKIPITHKDIKNILINRPDLAPTDFIRELPIVGKSESIELLNDKDEKIELALRTKENSRECMFLLPDNKCSINDFKPLACKIWPFSIEKTGRLKWDVKNRDFIKKRCSHKIQEGGTDPVKLEEYINSFYEQGNEMIELSKLWNKNKEERSKYNNNFFDFFIANS